MNGKKKNEFGIKSASKESGVIKIPTTGRAKIFAMHESARFELIKGERMMPVNSEVNTVMLRLLSKKDFLKKYSVRTLESSAQDAPMADSIKEKFAKMFPKQKVTRMRINERITVDEVNLFSR